MTEPKVKVGILFEPEIEFVLLAPYRIDGCEISGAQTVTCRNGQIVWQDRMYDELRFEPADALSGSFEIRNVTIGINFHWERKEHQRFQGAFHLIVENDKLTGINVIGVEDYLISVISSEMSATASLELLKAHAVISRSWLLAQMEKNKTLADGQDTYTACTQTDEELIKWYDREDHLHFDVCADDHCQRYQGITRASTETVREAVAATRGELLMYDGKICDARFSKCCGGVFEKFRSCWEEVEHPYLAKQRDSKTATELPDLTVEAEADRWIRTSPESFCNTADAKILSQVLNHYDQETTQFYRWTVMYGQDELAALIWERSGIDFGRIIDLIPVGSKRTLTIGKELEIRRTLSTSHLYSSAFVIDKADISDGIPGRFTLTGAGWGHGVGLCQIGAAVMGERQYPYDEILLHYYIEASIEKAYD